MQLIDRKRVTNERTTYVLLQNILILFELKIRILNKIMKFVKNIARKNVKSNRLTYLQKK